MRKSVIILSVLLVSLFFMSCGGGDAISTADKFMKAYVVDYDSKEFSKYYDSKQREASLSPGMEEFHNMQKEIIKSLKLNYKLNKEKTLINESGASVYYELTSGTNPNLKQEVRVDLNQDTDGKWFVKYETIPRRF